MRCRQGHTWEDCQCPADMIDRQAGTRSMIAFAVALGIGLLVIAVLASR